MATTINSYSVGLGLDASNYIRNSNLSRRETTALKRDIAAARTPAENYERKLTQLEKALQEGAIDQRTFNRLLDTAADKMRKAERAAQGMGGATSRIGFGKLAGGLAAITGVTLSIEALARAITDLTVESVTLAGKMEMTELKFKNLIGNAEEARDVIGQLKELTAKTPFQFGDIQQAAQTLLTFDTSTKDLQRELLILGNVSAATGGSLSDFATILGRARGSNSVGLEDINRLVDRGVGIYELLADRLSVTKAEIKSLASTGKLEASDLMAVFQALGDEGGKFGTSMEEASQTLEGRISTLKDNFEALQVQIGQGLVPETNRLVIALTEVVTTIRTTDFSPWVDGANSVLAKMEQLNSLVMAPVTFLIPDLGIESTFDNLQQQADRAAKLQEEMLQKQQQAEQVGRDIEKRELDRTAEIVKLEDKITKSQDEQLRKQEQLVQARERYERTLQNIAKREAQEYERFIERFERAIADGPGSGGIDDRAGFLAERRNAELAAEARRNFELQGGGPDTTDFAARDEAAEQLKKIAEMEKTAAEAREQTNELLKQLNQTKPQRIR